jgi:hypothetical protein
MPDWSRRDFVRGGTGTASAAQLTAGPQVSQTLPKESSDRDYWIATLTQFADPVLVALSRRRLKAMMPVEALFRELRSRFASFSTFEVGYRERKDRPTAPALHGQTTEKCESVRHLTN